MKGRNPVEKSCVLLVDGATFPKLMPHQNLTTVVMVALEEDAGDYGVISMKEDFWAFAEQAEFAGNADFVRFTQVSLEPPGSSTSAVETAKLVDSIDDTYLHGRKSPRIYLYQPGSMVADMYPQYSSINVIALSRWLSQMSRFYMGVPGTIQAFYNLARKYVLDVRTVDDPVQFRADVLAETNEMVTTIDAELKSEEYTDLARYYVKTMERIAERGDEYVMAEVLRLEELVSGADIKLSAEKRQVLQKRVNILHNFVTFPERVNKDEL